MLRATISLAVALLAAAAVCAAPQDDDSVFSLGDGRFEISGRKPRGFAELQYLYVEGARLRKGGGADFRRLTPVAPARVKGELYGRGKFRMKSVAFDGERFTFETVAVGGVSFRFDGTVYNAAESAEQLISPAFRGALVKLVNGRKAAEAQVTFGHLEPEY